MSPPDAPPRSRAIITRISSTATSADGAPMVDMASAYSLTVACSTVRCEPVCWFRISATLVKRVRTVPEIRYAAV